MDTVSVRAAGRPRRDAHSELDEELIRVASGNGPYVALPGRLGHSAGGEAKSFEASGESDVRLQLVNRYQWPLAAAIMLFAAESLWLAVMPWLRTWGSLRKAQAQGEKQHG